MTPGEVCRLLKISERTLWRYQDDGHIKAVRLPSGHRRFLRSDVEQLLARLRGDQPRDRILPHRLVDHAAGGA